ncbi:hypothetical protein ACFYVL_36465 [Streptomyces sp. NPDC004111]|uniref:hypothetical protein n=1 Tax=Streptomyces sp. NPDC004111 TaxID=3364690 RepID=UPI0036C7CC3D
MRMSRTAGLLLSTAVCGALALGTAGPAFSAVGAPSTAAAVDVPPIPGAEALGQQTKVLGDAAGVLKPVTDLLTAALAAPGGKLPAADADSLGKAVTDAIAKAGEAAPKAPTRGAEAVDLKAKALADLQVKVTALLEVAKKGDPKALAVAVQATITASVNVLVSIVLGGGLPAADLPGLPKLPTLPGVPPVPALPGVPETPKLPAVPGTPELPAAPALPAAPSVPGLGG